MRGEVSLNEQLHLPDLAFVKEAQSQFYVNRGIYNTIDAWFYQNGFINIVDRRKHIIQFLSYAYEIIKDDQESKHMYFPKGLVSTLEEYRKHALQLNNNKTNQYISLLDN